ncbi:hypothetical protein BZG02_13530 [Labilibaculum filiforme]|uniref:Uncharacterized protein n=1 Tax=Labilibaculum filiforme TaxID=1940526 RepID=A0A2N3HW72_9BACT|nr:hypothetical protein [Labilibaculum filiforme]PKQ62325.1 hypothetical protein BZG02_13530 [Labilibaculum filiforme]
MENKFELKQFLIITLITSIWIHIGEMARALFVAFPRIAAFFEGKMQIIGLEQAELSHALIWGAWDTLLTAVLVFVFWLCAKAFGNNVRAILVSGTVTCFATIGIFWIAFANTGLGEWSTAFILFPLAWIELVIGAWIASKLYARKGLN